ncbi:hypothetical protein Ciccas_001067 [Cichlidogyrus casuarinus]|uniref:Uncharacterized protein n=1 Tax=Cichlidogyrus casuarinus TaxID=1844966 RepID=A0ABD2QL70_9PLAT
MYSKAKTSSGCCGACFSLCYMKGSCCCNPLEDTILMSNIARSNTMKVTSAGIREYSFNNPEARKSMGLVEQNYTYEQMVYKYSNCWSSLTWDLYFWSKESGKGTMPVSEEEFSSSSKRCLKLMAERQGTKEHFLDVIATYMLTIIAWGFAKDDYKVELLLIEACKNVEALVHKDYTARRMDVINLQTILDKDYENLENYVISLSRDEKSSRDDMIEAICPVLSQYFRSQTKKMEEDVSYGRTNVHESSSMRLMLRLLGILKALHIVVVLTGINKYVYVYS